MGATHIKGGLRVLRAGGPRISGEKRRGRMRERGGGGGGFLKEGRGNTKREREERKNRGIGEEESLCFSGRCGDFGSVFQETERGEQMLSEAKK